jgi:hypothetical protein
MRKSLFAATAILLAIIPVLAQDAEVGKEYDITIESEDNNQYVGAYGEVFIGKIDFMVPNAKTGEKYHVKVTGIALNQYTGNQQAACDFKQTGGSNRAGSCIPAP